MVSNGPANYDQGIEIQEARERFSPVSDAVFDNKNVEDSTEIISSRVKPKFDAEKPSVCKYYLQRQLEVNFITETDFDDFLRGNVCDMFLIEDITQDELSFKLFKLFTRCKATAHSTKIIKPKRVFSKPEIKSTSEFVTSGSGSFPSTTSLETIECRSSSYIIDSEACELRKCKSTGVSDSSETRLSTSSAGPEAFERRKYKRTDGTDASDTRASTRSAGPEASERRKCNNTGGTDVSETKASTRSAGPEASERRKCKSKGDTDASDTRANNSAGSETSEGRRYKSTGGSDASEARPGTSSAGFETAEPSSSITTTGMEAFVSSLNTSTAQSEPRQLTPSAIKAISETSKSTSAICVESSDVEELARPSSNTAIKFIILDDPSHYERICIMHPNTSIHHLKYIRHSNVLQWVRSSGGVCTQKFRTQKKNCNESELFQNIGTNYVLCLHGGSTVGKTTMLASLVQHLEGMGQPVAYIEAKQIIKAIEAKVNIDTDFAVAIADTDFYEMVVKIIAENGIVRNYSRYDKLNFSHIFLDGFDEIDQNLAELWSHDIIARIRKAFSTQRICLAVRTSLKNILCDNLPLASSEIKLFTEKEYTKLLITYIMNDCMSTCGNVDVSGGKQITTFVTSYIERQFKGSAVSNSLLSNPKYFGIVARLLANHVNNAMHEHSRLRTPFRLTALNGSSLVELQAKTYKKILKFEIRKCVDRYYNYKGGLECDIASRLHQDAQYKALLKVFNGSDWVLSDTTLAAKEHEKELIANYEANYESIFPQDICLVDNENPSLSLSAYLSATVLHKFLLSESPYKNMKFKMFKTFLISKEKEITEDVTGEDRIKSFVFTQIGVCQFLDCITRRYLKNELLTIKSEHTDNAANDETNEEIRNAIRACIYHRLSYLGMRILSLKPNANIIDSSILALATSNAKVAHVKALYDLAPIELLSNVELLQYACYRGKFSLVEYRLNNEALRTEFKKDENFARIIRVLKHTERPFCRLPTHFVQPNETEMIFNYLWNIRNESTSFTKYFCKCIPWSCVCPWLVGYTRFQ